MLCKWHNHIIVTYLFIGLFVNSWIANYLLVISEIGEHPTMSRFYECPRIHCVRKKKVVFLPATQKFILCSITKIYENDMNFIVNSSLLIDST